MRGRKIEAKKVDRPARNAFSTSESAFSRSRSAAGHPLSADPNFDLKYLLVIGPAFGGKPIFRWRLPAPLQKFLQSGLSVSFKKRAATLL